MSSYLINHTLRQIRETIFYAKGEISAALRDAVNHNEGWSYQHDIELFETNIDSKKYIVELVLDEGYNCPDYEMFANQLDVSDIL